MAVLRDIQTGNNPVNYITTLAFFCCISCIIAMLKFGRFKTSFNVYGEKKRKSASGLNDIGNVMSINGAYRINRDEFFIYNNTEPQRKSTPTVPVPPSISSEPIRPIRQVRSTSDLTKNKNVMPPLHDAQPGLSLHPRGAENENSHNKNKPIHQKTNRQLDAERRVEKQRIEEKRKLERQRLEEHKKLEKQRLEEEKKREKLASQERAKQERLKKEREKWEAQLLKKKNKNKKGAAPQKPLANPLAQSSGQANNSTAVQPNGPKYSTNTLDSSISKTSGPPPYTEDLERSENGNNSNVIFSKPMDTGSWDMISQHRHNVCIKRPVTDTHMTEKVTTLDMNFTLGEQISNGNSEV